MQASILKIEDLSEIENDVLGSDGNLKVVDTCVYQKYSQSVISQFCVKHAFYGLPTTESCNLISELIGTRKAIEIGAGNGALGRYLNIPMTDSFMQEQPEIAAYYKALNQPTINYGSDVIAMEAIDAVKNSQPEVVVGSWITHKYLEERHELGGNMYGVDEESMLSRISTYIMIGNLHVHHNKPILHSHKCRLIKHESLFGRSLHSNENVIMIWDA